MRFRGLVTLVSLTVAFVLLATQSAFGVVLLGGLGGVVHKPDGNPGTPVTARIDPVPSGSSIFEVTDTNGAWGTQLSPGTYKVMFTQSMGYGWGFYTSGGLVPIQSMGETVTVSGGSTRTIDATLPPGASISGKVTAHATGLGLKNDINLFYQNATTGVWENVFGLASGDDGAYHATNLLPGTYRMRFYDDIFYRYVEQWWNGKPNVLSADGISVGLGQSLTGYNTVLYANVTSQTIAGDSRIETAIRASNQAFGGPSVHADAVVITNGYNWPDALGGSALAGALNAPILLNSAPPAPMPAILDNEVVRLRNDGATEAYILGSDKAVSSAVEQRLIAIFGQSHVHRLGGAGRYDTSIQLANTVVSTTGGAWDGTVFLAKGSDYPDALAASPLSSYKKWPVVLAENDGHGNLSQRVRDFLTANATTKVVILGSENAIPSSMATSAANAVGGWSKVERWAGPDRVATAIDIAKHSRTNGLNSELVGMATAYGYADALAGGPFLGANQRAPLLLTADATPLRTALSEELTSLSPNVGMVWFLGGTKAVRQTVRDAIVDKLR